MPICPKCRGENPELGAKCPRDGYYYIHDDAIDDAEKDDWIGRLAADKYVILSLISEGGMGAVYRAMQLPVQREVAFKVLRAELQDSDQGQDRFAREARAVSRLTHPNIITMHDFGVDDDGHPFMVMEYAPGKSLADWIMQPGLKLDRIAHVFRQILSALSEAHEQGIVHRDLKPENLIVTRTGSDKDYIKLLDFGIARMVHDGATRGLTKEGEVFGTPHYMAPEQAQGKKNIGPPADVYALGIMLYELLSGECPFDAPTPLSILYMHINDDLPELEPRNGVSVPAPVQEVIDRATAKAPEDRYPTAGEMLEAFDQALGTAGGYVAPAGTSSEVINTTQKMGSQVRTEKATADTLHFQDAQAQQQRVTDSSNAVPVNDPQQSGTTTFEMEALGGTNATKYLLVAAALAVLMGVAAALLLTGDDKPAEATDDDEAVATQKDEAKPAADQEAKAEAQEPEVAAKDDEKPETDDGEQPAPKEGNETTDKAEVAAPAAVDDKPKTANTRPATTTEAADTKKAERPTTTDDSVAEKPDDSRSGNPGAKPDETSSATNSQADDEPKKFQPKKFQRPEPKDSDDEPKKFQPKKWR